VISDGPSQGVWVASADCTPVLIGDVKTGQVAAIHAGWRGTAARIVPKTVAKFQQRGSDLANLRIAMGPAIAGEVYQVDPPVALQVGQSLTTVQQLNNPAAQWDYLYHVADPPVLPDPEPHKCRLDVRRINALQLGELGIAETQMAIAPYCTFQTPEHFFSYRRTHTKEVQWSGIVSF
jgi:YfiH family protein